MLPYILVFLISTGIFLFLFFIEKNKSKENTLHYIQKSCNIDSVRFEKQLTLLQHKVKKQISYLKKIITKIKQESYFLIEKLVKKIKLLIRKKLFQSKEKKQTSSFIEEIKNNIK